METNKKQIEAMHEQLRHLLGCGWTRTEAIKEIAENTYIGINDIEEVDRLLSKWG